MTVLTRQDKDWAGSPLAVVVDVSFYVQECPVQRGSGLVQSTTNTKLQTAVSDAGLIRAHTACRLTLQTHGLCAITVRAEPPCRIEPDRCPVVCCFLNKHRAGRTNTAGPRAKNMPQHVTTCPSTYLGPPLNSSPPATTSIKGFPMYSMCLYAVYVWTGARSCLFASVVIVTQVLMS